MVRQCFLHSASINWRLTYVLCRFSPKTHVGQQRDTLGEHPPGPRNHTRAAPLGHVQTPGSGQHPESQSPGVSEDRVRTHLQHPGTGQGGSSHQQTLPFSPSHQQRPQDVKAASERMSIKHLPSQVKQTSVSQGTQQPGTSISMPKTSFLPEGR